MSAGTGRLGDSRGVEGRHVMSESGGGVPRFNERKGKGLKSSVPAVTGAKTA